MTSMTNPGKSKKEKLDANDILREEIEKTRKQLPFSLSVKDLAELTGIGKTKIYENLNSGKIPGANKLMGQWRIPRDRFLSWWYGGGEIDGN